MLWPLNASTLLSLSSEVRRSGLRLERRQTGVRSGHRRGQALFRHQLTHAPPMQTPCLVQSSWHVRIEQSSPLYLSGKMAAETG